MHSGDAGGIVPSTFRVLRVLLERIEEAATGRVLPDFLDAENHPHLVFTAAQVTPDADGYRAAGSVTVKGKTSPLEVEITNVEFDADRGTFTATATIDRNAIGVGKLPSLVIAPRLRLNVTATAVIDA